MGNFFNVSQVPIVFCLSLRFLVVMFGTLRAFPFNNAKASLDSSLRTFNRQRMANGGRVVAAARPWRAVDWPAASRPVRWSPQSEERLCKNFLDASGQNVLDHFATS